MLREFDVAIKIAPRRAEVDWLERNHSDAVLHTFIKPGASRAREMRWLGSYRYATISLGERDRDDVLQRFDAIRDRVSFERASRLDLVRLEVLRPRV